MHSVPSDSDCAQIRTIWLASDTPLRRRRSRRTRITSVTPDDKDELMGEQHKVDFSAKSDRLVARLQGHHLQQALLRRRRHAKKQHKTGLELLVVCRAAVHSVKKSERTMKRKDQSGPTPVMIGAVMASTDMYDQGSVNSSKGTGTGTGTSASASRPPCTTFTRTRPSCSTRPQPTSTSRTGWALW